MHTRTNVNILICYCEYDIYCVELLKIHITTIGRKSLFYVMNKSTCGWQLNKGLVLVCCLLILMTQTACAVSNNLLGAVSGSEEQVGEAISESIEEAQEAIEETEEAIEDIQDAIETFEEEKEEILYSEEDMIDFDASRPFEYCEQPMCSYNSEDDEVLVEVSFDEGIPISDDDDVYLFEISTYEYDGSIADKEPIAKAHKNWTVNLCVPFYERLLFARFVPALLSDGEYVPLSHGQYITNPEALAANTSDYPEVASKKGLLLDANTLGTDMLSDLDVKRVVYNVPLSYIIGECENPEYPTIDYEYNGQIYHFNGYLCAGFDSLFAELTAEGYHNTAIILNDWNADYQEIIHPLSRNKTRKSLYYAFNTEDEKGVRLMEATAKFLAERYSGGEYGMVHDWVIANEINQQTIWNYMDTDDLIYYTESFERSFRTFYNAIKSNYSNAHVYFSIDHDWNDNGGNNKKFFNGKELLYTFNEIAKARGNYDWGLSVHPYPEPLTKVKFWRGEFDKTEDARVLTPMNFSTVTDVLTKDDFADTNGNVRDIAVTELGFSSKPGEKLHAAAFAYCYYIIEDNDYISSFLLNRQTDDKESLKSGLALGIYNNDYSAKYVADVFKNIDSPRGEGYIDEMLEVIGADSLEDALDWAR